MPADRPPLIVTAHLDDASFAVLDGLRHRHFPAKLNRIPAHISLFHHLPGDEEPRVLATVRALAGRTVAFALQPLAARSLGRGVALAYESAELAALRAALARELAAWLTPQDRQGFKPHVTIQNKVEASAARALLAELAGVPPPPCRVEGVAIWRYLGGPWERVATCPFADVARTDPPPQLGDTTA